MDGTEASITKIQALLRARRAREQFVTQKGAAVRVQSSVRGWRTRGSVVSLAFGTQSRSKGRKKSAFGSSISNMMLSAAGANDVAESLANAKMMKARQRARPARLYDAHHGRALTFTGTRLLDKRRKALLGDARKLSPIDMVLRFDKFGQTVLSKLLWHPVAWLLIGTYTASAVCSRLGYLKYADLDNETFEGSGVLITFMIVFYVGCAPCLARRALPRRPPLREPWRCWAVRCQWRQPAPPVTDVAADAARVSRVGVGV